eukprot:TRINITY_DN29772_c0_g1_i1.p1 TRINITY_DN29772_c0_g1~~TRINITY_DN29772_c0_g1_i1.p1  ORF type:complete len:306 (-),score=21.12 TRINITY_DN29772_c0_g1_i1:48-965(-)
MTAANRLGVVKSQLEDRRARELVELHSALSKFINAQNCHPIMVRLAWHDSGTFDKKILRWPQCGGANGSIRFQEELGHGANAGLIKAINFLKPFKTQFPTVSWADLIQMASAVSIELAGGPRIAMRYGRVDAEVCPPEGNLPGAAAPFGDGAPNAATHLGNVFHRMGFSDQEIVALSGAHTLGRAFKERSGTVQEGYGKGTSYTSQGAQARGDGKAGIGMPGGRSWTEKWLRFDNSYYQRTGDASKLLWLPTDQAISEASQYKEHFQRYAKDQRTFFEEYAAAHKKLSELGSKFDPPEGIEIRPQ